MHPKERLLELSYGQIVIAQKYLEIAMTKNLVCRPMVPAMIFGTPARIAVGIGGNSTDIFTFGNM